VKFKNVKPGDIFGCDDPNGDPIEHIVVTHVYYDFIYGRLINTSLVGCQLPYPGAWDIGAWKVLPRNELPGSWYVVESGPEMPKERPHIHIRMKDGEVRRIEEPGGLRNLMREMPKDMVRIPIPMSPKEMWEDTYEPIPIPLTRTAVWTPEVIYGEMVFKEV